MLISTVADIPNTRKKRSAFPAISLKEIMFVEGVESLFFFQLLLLCIGLCNMVVVRDYK